MTRLLGLLLLSWPLLVPAALDADERARWLDAVTHNQLQILHELRSRVERVDLRDGKGKTALMAAAAAGSADLAQALIQQGADPHALNVMGSTTLVYAAWSGDTQVMALLLSHGVALDTQARNGWTAMMMAAAKHHVPALSLLCEAGADPNRQDVYLWTPLMRAAYEGHRSAVTALLACPGVDLALLNDQGQTALHLAAISGDAKIFQALLARGGDPEAVDYDGNTPRSIAKALANREILAIIDADPARLNRRLSAGG